MDFTGDTTPPKPSTGHSYKGNLTNAYWVGAKDIGIGHRLIDDKGNYQTVIAIHTEATPLNSYNLEVDTDHTFFIKGIDGVESVWVHNDCFDSVNLNLNRLPLELKEAAHDTLSHVNKGTVPSWLAPNRRGKWGSDFGNRNGDLPQLTANGDKITYKEYDIINTRGGNNAGIDRIVVGSDGRVYYTGTHYGDTGGKPFGRIK